MWLGRVLVIFIFIHAGLAVPISLASWNIQDLGVTKAGRPEVMKMLTTVVTRYDIFFIQELSQSPTSQCGANTGSVICSLFADVQAAGAKLSRTYGMVVSPRVGETGQEQYVTIYNTKKLRLIESFLYKETPTTQFTRPPFIVKMGLVDDPSDASAFYAANIHTSPDLATEEVLRFADVGVYISGLASKGSNRVILLGDFNAACSYFNEQTEWPKVFAKLPGWSQIIADKWDTTVRKSTDCAYDRMISSPALSADATLSSGQPFFFDDTSKGGYSMAAVIKEGCSKGYLTTGCPNSVTTEEAALKISDHFPVTVNFNMGRASAIDVAIDVEKQSVLVDPAFVYHSASATALPLSFLVIVCLSVCGLFLVFI